MQDLVSCDNSKDGGEDQGCNGGLMDNAFEWIEKNGLCTEDAYPYTSGGGTSGKCKKTCSPVVTVSKYTDVPKGDEDALKDAVSKQPVSIAVDASGSQWQLYKSGVFNHPTCGTELDHGVLLVGFGAQAGTDYWKIKNSWGATWGIDGYMHMKAGSNMCGLANSASYPTATAMGYYIFTDATTKTEVRVEYTFGYKRCSDGKVRIYLHHSSVPYSSAPAAASSGVAAMTQAEVLDCQAKWANAIKTISQTYADKGDYVGAAADAAGELYGYGHSQVLFKPTKAAEYPFRPTGEEAMSYFVGNNAVEGGYDEDAGFAINGGKGWKDVVFTNHGIELLGPAAVAMGSYVFTCATTGDEAKVEYTFGYQRNDDGKPRIFLHHSSVPYSA